MAAPEPVTEFIVAVSQLVGQSAGGPGRSCSLTSDLNANSSHDHEKKIGEISIDTLF